MRIDLMAAIFAAAMFGALPANADDGDMSPEEQAVVEAMDAALPGSLLHNPLRMAWNNSGSDLKLKVVPAAELTTGEAIQARNKKRQGKPWDTNLNLTLPEGVSSGDTIEVYFWLRTAKPASGSETAKVDLFVGRNTEPYDAIIAEELTPGTEWELKSTKATAGANFPAGEIKLEYQFGRASQTVEVGPVYVSKLD